MALAIYNSVALLNAHGLPLKINVFLWLHHITSRCVFAMSPELALGYNAPLMHTTLMLLIIPVAAYILGLQSNIAMIESSQLYS